MRKLTVGLRRCFPCNVNAMLQIAFILRRRVAADVNLPWFGGLAIQGGTIDRVGKFGAMINITLTCSYLKEVHGRWF